MRDDVFRKIAATDEDALADRVDVEREQVGRVRVEVVDHDRVRLVGQRRERHHDREAAAPRRDARGRVQHRRALRPVEQLERTALVPQRERPLEQLRLRCAQAPREAERRLRVVERVVRVAVRDPVRGREVARA